MINSNKQFEMDDSFNLSVVHVRPPSWWSGSRRRYESGHQSNVRPKQVRKNVIANPGDEAQLLLCEGLVMGRGLRMARYNPKGP